MGFLGTTFTLKGFFLRLFLFKTGLFPSDTNPLPKENIFIEEAM
jgi:hypothetical protein